MGHHALLSGHTCPVQQGHVSRLAHGHAESPLLAGEVGKLGGGGSAPVLQVREMQPGVLGLEGLVLTYRVVLEGATWFLRGEDSG